ncbi:16S rRNA (adenine(1518)-N(6)/adenine(1519)-N(6))-dimethyltransferase RsmA [Wenzhouxiangella sp. XN24]|uniref:16S rRNA (adenine(1518)-N(6)/adenine(1519)-N(6))- dimethyltransferase RsmA n=1 Tax=Wenzhouxiangella sp. XN24 TaxID=2713569 RepID=UPI0013ED7989|nr:16S rRNA (adenine(1518)-N(6)/adenine(1519)-N(6))-dimethyltransferase RsmA [Wenzhouxiangella sp. XN24]NGX15798.1 16S rRNA (adenine(1518)-N(6)/adenine(1519)-N(6))-dimethyltransferase RsmA [Wenzhouxiangella sp. XN24]
MSHAPRKRFGQHFLHDATVIERIVAAVDPVPGERLVEIGPGEGALTMPLLRRGARLTVIELDRDLAARLAARPEAGDSLTVIQGDALRMDLAALAGDGPPLRLVGNLPYNISTPLLFRFIQQAAVIEDMHFMLQREVVERMTAGPGSKTYGRLSVMIAVACRVEALFDIGPGAFRPPPKVWSSIVRLAPWRDPPFPVVDPQRFAEVVRRAFGQRRKTLRNALAGLVDADTIRMVGCDPGARAETLSPGDFARLAAATRL